MPEFMIPFVVIHCIGLVIVLFATLFNLTYHSTSEYKDDRLFREKFRKARINAYHWLKWSLLWEVPAGIAFYNMISGARKDIRDVEKEELEKALDTVRREIAKKNEEERREFDRQLYGRF